MLRAIRGFHRDADGAWVAELLCGHNQHVRHDPPWQNRPWVADAAARQARLGSELDCVFCNMAALPEGLTAYKQTATFSERDVPAGLLRDHRTQAGVWAEIIVEEGKLEYTCGRGSFVLCPGVVGIVEPTQPHHVRPLGEVRFYVRFRRDSDERG
jgi:tellurite resistance-related uncharacterized protein